MSNIKLWLVHCGACFLLAGASSLSNDYYQELCPNLESMVRSTLLPVFLTDPRSPAAFLRLLFHDCQVQGCDASILLDTDEARGIKSEMESGKIFGIRNRDSIGLVKERVESACPGQVSCSDLIVLAAREAVAYSGGPMIKIPLGRKDGTIGSNLRADDELPSASIEVDGALRIFLSKGMSIEEAVAILGAHSIGAGHCLNLVYRLYGSKAKHEKSMEQGFEALLRLKCSAEAPLGNDSFVFNDLTPVHFDNQYYRDVMSGRGVFTVDDGISIDPRTASVVKGFAEDQDRFFRAFSDGFVKLSMAMVVTGDDGRGEVRRYCNRVNYI